MKSLEREIDRPDGQIERAGLDRPDIALILLARNRFPLDDVAGTKEGHKIPEVGQLLCWVIDWRGGNSEHLVAPGAAYRVDTAKAAAVADGELRRIGARPQIFRHLDLLRSLDHLE